MEARKLAVAAHPAQVLTKAFLRAGEQLGLPQRVLARIIGVSEASLSRLGSMRRIAPDSKEGELAALFLRVFRSLDALLGGNAEQRRQWLHAHNVHLSGVPVALVQTTEGLVRVAEYLDAMRGRG